MTIKSLRRSSLVNDIKYENFSAGYPSAPTIGTVTVTNSTTVSIPFTVGSNGGYPITSYTVTSNPSISLSVSGTSSPLTVTGAFAGNTSYTFTIAAVNANGASAPSSASNSVTPVLPTVTGGALTSDATYYYRTFIGNGTLTVSNSSLPCDILVVAGGGAGGPGGVTGTTPNRILRAGGGGGAGGAAYSTSQSLSTTSYSVTIGAGGTGTNFYSSPTSGQASSLGSYTSVGGGYGGWLNAGQTFTNGANGGSGGGAGELGDQAGVACVGGTPGTGTSGQGSAGGNGVTNGASGAGGAGGGGGAGGVGGTGTIASSGNGGSGATYFGTIYAGGGGAGGTGTGNSTGGSSIGGAGGSSPTAGTVNTGSGGGGSVTSSIASGNGGSGIVIVRYTRASVGG
jgi:hypothetical protein